MDFLELKIVWSLLGSKKSVFFFLSSVVLAMLPLPPSLQTFIATFYNVLGTFVPKIKIPVHVAPKSHRH